MASLARQRSLNRWQVYLIEWIKTKMDLWTKMKWKAWAVCSAAKVDLRAVVGSNSQADLAARDDLRAAVGSSSQVDLAARVARKGAVSSSLRRVDFRGNANLAPNSRLVCVQHGSGHPC